MEPFSKDDPLHRLLEKSRMAEPRPNFTQNVLRAARQTPQSVGLWERCTLWLREEGGARVLWQGALAATAVLTLSLVALKHTGSTPVPTSDAGSPVAATNGHTTPEEGTDSDASISAEADEMPVEAVVASELEDLDQLSILLAQRDTSALSDSDIAALLY